MPEKFNYNKNFLSENIGKNLSEINWSPYRYQYKTKERIHFIMKERSELLMAFTAMQK